MPRAQGKDGKGLATVLREVGLNDGEATRWQYLLKKTEAEIRAFVGEADEQVTMPRAYAWASGDVHFSSDTPEWCTPAELVAKVVEVLGSIDLDPCADPEHRIPAKAHYTQKDDGLSRLWSGKVYMSPPYGREHGCKDGGEG